MNNAGLKEALIRREIDGAIARPAIEDDGILCEKLHDEPLIIALPDAFEPRVAAATAPGFASGRLIHPLPATSSSELCRPYPVGVQCRGLSAA